MIKKYPGISKSTLSRKVREKQTNPFGRPKAISDENLKYLRDACLEYAIWGFPLTRFEIRILVREYLNTKGIEESRFSNNLPSSAWAKQFIAMTPELSERLCENIKRSRAAVTREIMKDFFRNAEPCLKNTDPKFIVNYDETATSNDPGREKVVVRKGSKHSERIIDQTKTNISVMFAINAAGESLSPYVCYKSEHLYDTWQDGGPEGAKYDHSKSGWFDTYVFTNWFKQIVIPYFRKLDPKYEFDKIVIGDNLTAHTSLDVLKLCQKHKIKFLLLPANSTHLSQPLTSRHSNLSGEKYYVSGKKNTLGLYLRILFHVC